MWGDRIATRSWLAVLAGLTALGIEPALARGQSPYCPNLVPPGAWPWPGPATAPDRPASPADTPAEPRPAPGAERIPAPGEAPPASNFTPELQPPASDPGESPSLFASSVDYIDTALIGNQVRLRFDSTYRDTQPSRAEFFYPKSAAAGGPGPPRPDTHVDNQELTTYLEVALSRRLSVFVEEPARFINPALNPNNAGFGDLNAGFKWAFQSEPNRVTTFQFRAYAPTGAADNGLGTNHVSLEPALLVYRRLTDDLAFNGELRYWLPIGGTDFAGDIIRYGAGLSYGQPNPNGFWVTPVAEVVGWTVLGGKYTEADGPGVFSVRSAAGNTIVNGKIGARFGFGTRADFMVGYGHALTGNFWYQDIIRVETRWRF